MNTATQQTPHSLVSNEDQRFASRWLVIGMGSYAYGKERRAVTALKHMPRIEPHFLTTVWEDGSVSDLLRRNGFEFTSATVGYLGRARLAWTLKNILLMPSLFIKALHAFRKNHCCGVLVLALQAFANLLPVLWFLKMFVRARIVFYLGDIPANSATNRTLCRAMGSMADVIIVNSEAVRRGLDEVGVPAMRVRVVYNGLDLARFRTAQPFRWREELKWAADAVLVGYAGQFAKNKGISDLVHAAEQVLRQNDRCRFLLIGRANNANQAYSELASHLHSQDLENKIVFTGWISEMERAYASLDIVVVPSRHDEPAANVIIEAMASGVPVIATRVGGNPELLSDGKTGYLVERQSPDQLAAKIIQLASDDKLRARFGSLARESAESRFDASKNAAVVEELMLSTFV